MDWQFLKYDSENFVLTISSPKTLNALNSTILSELDSFADWFKGVDAPYLIITGEGKAFVAGADISEMAGLKQSEAYKFGQLGNNVFAKFEAMKQPVIAAINGYALGGGCELALSCDIRIASDKAVFGQPEVGLGIIPGFGGTFRLCRIVGYGMAKELIYTGRNVKAEEALRIGLVNSVVAPEELMAKAMELGQMIAKKSSHAVALAKKAINGTMGCNSEMSQAESHLFEECFEHQHQVEGMKAFLEKRKPNFE